MKNVTRKKPFINERNRKIRLQFARAHNLKPDMCWYDAYNILRQK